MSDASAKLAAWAALAGRVTDSAKKKVDDVLDSMSGTDRLDKLAGIGGVTQLLVNGDERLETLLVDQSTIDYYIGKLTSVSDEQTAPNANERKSERVLAQQIVALLTTTNAVVGKCYTQSTVLDELFSPLKSESISPFLLAVLSKFHNLLWDIQFENMFIYIKQRPDFISSILNHISFSSAFEMIGKIIRSGIYNSTSGLLHFLQGKDVEIPNQTKCEITLEISIANQIIDRFHPKYDTRTHDGVLYAIQELTSAAMNDQQTLRFSAALRCWLCSTLLNDTTLRKLFSMMFAGGVSYTIISSRAACLRAVNELLALKSKATDSIVAGQVPLDDASFFSTSGANVPYDDSRVLTMLLPRMSGLRAMMVDIQKLSQNPKANIPDGVLMYRYDLFRFIAALSELDLTIVFDAFEQHGVVSFLTETFFTGVHNYFVAECVRRVFAQILISENASTACKDMLIKCRLLSRLVLADQEHRLATAPMPKPGKGKCLRFDGRHAERGAFLSEIFNLIASAQKQNQQLREAIANNKTFFSYAKLRAIQSTVPLGGTKPTSTSNKSFASPFNVANLNRFWELRDAAEVKPKIDPARISARWKSRSNKLTIGKSKPIDLSIPPSASFSDLTTSATHFNNNNNNNNNDNNNNNNESKHENTKDVQQYLLQLSNVLTRVVDERDDPIVDLSQTNQWKTYVNDELFDTMKYICDTMLSLNEKNVSSLSNIASTAAMKRFSTVELNQFGLELFEACLKDRLETHDNQQFISRPSIQYAMRVCGLSYERRPALDMIFDSLDEDDDTLITKQQFFNGLNAITALLSESFNNNNNNTNDNNDEKPPLPPDSMVPNKSSQESSSKKSDSKSSTPTSKKRSDRKSSHKKNSKSRDRDKEAERARRKLEKIEQEKLALEMEQAAIDEELLELELMKTQFDKADRKKKPSKRDRDRHR